VPLGQAEVKCRGDDVTVVATACALHKALQAAAVLADEISLEVIDPRTLVPLDVSTIAASVRKTGRLLVVHEAPARGGFGAEIVRQVLEQAFDYLDAAPKVLGGSATPIPFSGPLEDAVVPQAVDIVAAARRIMRAV